MTYDELRAHAKQSGGLDVRLHEANDLVDVIQKRKPRWDSEELEFTVLEIDLTLDQALHFINGYRVCTNQAQKAARLAYGYKD